MNCIRAKLIIGFMLSFAGFAPNVGAQNWSDFVFVSMTDPLTPKLVSNSICYTDSKDIACDGAAGRFTTSGSVVFTNISATALTVNGVEVNGSTALGDRLTSGSSVVTLNSATGIVSLTTGATTWGYLSSALSYLPSLNVGGTVSASAVSATLISSSLIQVGTGNSATCSAATKGALRYSSTSSTVEYCNSSAWTSLGPSSTSPVSFRVSRETSAQSIALSTWTGIDWNSEAFDTNSNFDLSTDRFTVSVPGLYAFAAGARMDNLAAGTEVYLSISKNGVRLATDYRRAAATGEFVNDNLTIFESAVAGDYFEVTIFQNSSSSPKNLTYGGEMAYFAGSLLGPQSGGSGGSVTPGGTDTQVQFNDGGSALGGNAGLTFNKTTGALTATVTSGTSHYGQTASFTTVYAAGNVGVGTATPSATLAVSGTLQIAGTGAETCNNTIYGVMRRNPATGRVQLCRPG